MRLVACRFNLFRSIFRTSDEASDKSINAVQRSLLQNQQVESMIKTFSPVKEQISTSQLNLGFHFLFLPFMYRSCWQLGVSC